MYAASGGGNSSPALMRLAGNRKLAAQVNGFQAPPPAQAAPHGQASAHAGGALTDEETQLLRRFLSGLGRR